MRFKRLLSSNTVKIIFRAILGMCGYLLLMEFLWYFCRNQITSNEDLNEVISTIYLPYTIFVLLENNIIKRVLITFVGAILSIAFLKINQYLDSVYFVIEHKSYKEGQFKINGKSIGYRIVEKEPVELSYHFNGVSDQSSLSKAIEDQDTQLTRIKFLVNKKTLGYLGIAHTPLIARAGYLVGDGVNVALFHKKRNFEEYELLKNTKRFPELLVKERILIDNSNELVVVVSTTFEVAKEELGILDIESKNLVYFETNIKGFDVVLSKNQIDNYVAVIMDIIRKITKTQQISKIHMILSTSVALTFKLGQSISPNNDPDVIFYHYDINSNKKYVWGIQVKKNSQDCVVIL